MARVTVEDCVLQVPNRFELVMLAAQRARNIAAGAPLTVDLDNDKTPVVALREIADTTIPLNELEENLVKSLQRFHETEETEPEPDADEDILASEALEVATSGPGYGLAEEAAEAGDEDLDLGDAAAEMDEAGDPMTDLESLDKEGEDVFAYEDVAEPED